MPSVSFILPAFKRAYLHEAIASILAQTYTDFELVVVDDCSPEDLKSIVDEFHDARLTYHRNAENLGGKSVVAAWNHAMEYATGEWCVLASDDDIYDRDYLKEMISLSERYPKVDIFHCRIGTIDKAGEITSLGEFRAEYETCLEFLYYRGIKRCAQVAPDFMFRRSAYQSIGGFVSFPYAIFSDDATWYMIAKDNGVVFSSKLLFYWRASGINICTRKDILLPKIQAVLDFIDWIQKFIHELGVSRDNDVLMKKLVTAQIRQSSDWLVYYYINQAGLIDWFRIVSKIHFRDKAMKHKIYWTRFKYIVSFKWLIK